MKYKVMRLSRSADHRALERLLNEQAAEGWVLDQVVPVMDTQQTYTSQMSHFVVLKKG